MARFHPQPSVLAAIQSATQKRRWRMPETVPTRRLLQRSTWTDRGLGRIKRRRHEPHVLLCDIFQWRHFEVGRIEREGHE